ncbi:alpha/beta hydrolase [Ohtaekwangia koreensis]|uniref:Serine aminopeptidase S33 domain-containing protein n=1 Tax=Ohtaekwangia koreensis TaxID=688867 RepID=A0A1T5JXD3_9BACT|nr:alpha/beta fold hydrolase [Ohtaekwangia koreensis]SKC56004.1 hypothetical protein SAMN05660236_1578 [Ohtaekwangia koreensis]
MKSFALLLLVTFLNFSFAFAQFDDKFYYPVTAWKPMEGISFEEVTLTTDTVKLSGIFLKPVGTPKATILFLHGAGGNVTSYAFMTKPLVDKGFQVFMIDFRGYGKSTGKPTHLNIARDGQFVFDYLISRKEVKNTKLILFGASIGTQIATKLAKDNADKVQALVLDGPMTSFTDIALAYAPAEQHAMIKQYLVSPYTAKEDIKSVAAPKLIVHSKEDKEVPIAGAEVVYNNATGQKEFWVYQGGHLEAMKVNPDTYISKIEALLK